MAYTLEDYVKLNPTYKKRYDPNTNKAYLTNTKTGKEINFGVGQGQQYGIGSLQNGSQTIDDVNKLTSYFNTQAEPSAYQSPYSSQITGTLAAISNRPSFSYDPSTDTGLQAAQGETMDAVSRAAARRGMLYSDSNKSQMGKSALALVPQFQQVAQDQYNQEGQSLYNQLSALSGLENQQYSQYRDTIGDQRYLDESQMSAQNAEIERQNAELERQLKQAELDAYDPALSRQENQLKIEQIKAQIAATNRSNQTTKKTTKTTGNYEKALQAGQDEIYRLISSGNNPTGEQQQQIMNKWLAWYGLNNQSSAQGTTDQPSGTYSDDYLNGL